MNEINKYSVSEKEKSLTELMGRLLKEPMKPLEQAILKINDDINHFDKNIGEISTTILLCQEAAEEAEKQGKEALKLLKRHTDEQSAWLPTLKTYITEQTQAETQTLQTQLNAHADQAAKILSVTTSSLTHIRQEQDNTAQSIKALLEKTEQSHLSLEKSLKQEEARLASTNTALASGLKEMQSSIGHLLTQQQRATDDRYKTLAQEMAQTFGQTHSLLEDSLHTGQSLRDTVSNNHADLLAALEQQAGQMNALLKRNQTNMMMLIILVGLLFTSLLAYIAYDLNLLGKLS